MRKCQQAGYEHLIVLDSIWFPVTTYCYINKGEIECIGIVTVKDTTTDEIKKCIGCGKGKNPTYDEDLIVACGSTYNVDKS